MGGLLSKTVIGSSDIFFPEDPLQVPLRTGFNQGGTENKSLRKVVEERCPSLWKPFKPVWWLYNGHMQTLYVVLGNFKDVDKVVYERTYLRLMDGGTLGLDFTPVDQSGIPDETPVLVVLTGLTGGSYEAYIRSILTSACRPTSEGGLGYRAVVVNFRGCAGIPLTSKQLYSAGYTDDIRVALMHIVKRYPKAPLLGMGFSLGANVLVRYLAEEGDKSRLVSGCALGCPWDVAKNNDALEESFLGRNVYSKGMASNLIRILNNHASRLRSPPPQSPSAPPTPVKPNPVHDAVVLEALNKALSLRSPTLEQFDDAFTSKAGGAPPVLPLASSKEYYAWASSHYVLPKVKRPLLVINANDDPVVKYVPTRPEEVENNSTIVVITHGGGHLGWFEVAEAEGEKDGAAAASSGPSLDSSGLTRWIKQPVLEWLRLVAEEFALSSLAPDRGRPVYEDADGWTREVGLDERRKEKDGDVWGPLGCRVIPAHEVEEGVVQGENAKGETRVDGTRTKTNGVFQGL
ncbi:hypothetical protein D9758_007712 [Tetrapyrgos nigripes]|uniref:AB hydrolase-1 domain-containing protein n=1 Tax=Tetrapyrgos nigripes TaxID=182062 RepID=A0A8H5G593_9AGAR|nr:hypothetical protein D9758_007712 [Tetrapyrgos nigripes]